MIDTNLDKWFIEPKYKKLYLEIIKLQQNLQYPQSEGQADKKRYVERFEDWLSKNKY